jgi:hypothetical protein
MKFTRHQISPPDQVRGRSPTPIEARLRAMAIAEQLSKRRVPTQHLDHVIWLRLISRRTKARFQPKC